ncbi:hypothetical protein T10_11244 [Trichinella papuae]|uniref:Uncharacterized protein n=1 Tax=Trichinella papuae TaxID=268474 RepID=A0A0V1M927_9BILA|nr:hypothetical protein T10_11244 [Trichinella papuae]
MSNANAELDKQKCQDVHEKIISNFPLATTRAAEAYNRTMNAKSEDLCYFIFEIYEQKTNRLQIEVENKYRRVKMRQRLAMRVLRVFACRLFSFIFLLSTLSLFNRMQIGTNFIVDAVSNCVSASLFS